MTTDEETISQEVIQDLNLAQTDAVDYKSEVLIETLIAVITLAIIFLFFLVESINRCCYHQFCIAPKRKGKQRSSSRTS